MTSLLQIVLGMGLLMLAYQQWLPHQAAIVIQPMENDAANQVAIMAQGTQTMMNNTFGTMITTIPVGGTVAYTPAQIAAVAPQMAGFVDQNVFGQKHVALISQPIAGALEAFIMTYGGDTVPDNTLVRVANAGPPGGVVILSNDTTNFEGANGGLIEATAPWVAPCPSCGAGYGLAAGHFGAHLSQTTYQTSSPYVARYWTGNAEDATMHQDLIMNGNNVKSALTVEATQQVKSPQLMDPGGVDQVTPAGTSQIVNLNASGTIKATIYSY
jgi:hypothetical protein